MITHLKSHFKNVPNVNSKESLDKVIAANSDKLHVIYFYNEWHLNMCRACEEMYHNIYNLSREYNNEGVFFCTCNLDKCRDLEDLFEIDAFSTVVVCKNSVVFEKYIGTSLYFLINILNKHVQTHTS